MKQYCRVKQGIKQGVIYALVAQLACPTAPVFSAPIVVDANAPASQKASLDAAPNGVPIVNIATPSRAGVSVNQFADYNVPDTGVIMNNSQAIARSELGGIIHANHQLVDGRSAGLVVFQVTGVGPSALMGYSEMHGDAADFILANPNGISINGGGFIGTPRVTLSTGVPGFDSDGALQTMAVHGGHVDIVGRGFNASNVDYVAIWARSMALHAQYYAKDTDIVLGNNTIDVPNGWVNPVTPVSNHLSGFSLDASELGSMYANAIELVSTDAGVGVRSYADIVAKAGNIQLQANGQLTVNGAMVATDEINVAAQSIENHGGMFSGGAMTISAQTNVVNSGDLVSQASMRIGLPDTLMNSGDILSLDDAIIDNANGGQTRAVTNMGGHIESLGNMAIRAEKIANIGHVETRSVDDDSESFWDTSTPGQKKHVIPKSKMVIADSGHSLAVIQSGGNMLLDGNVTNKVSLLAAKDALHITGDLDNQGVDLVANVDVETHHWDVVGSQPVVDGYETIKRAKQRTQYYSCWVFFRCKRTVTDVVYEDVPRYRYDPIYDWVSDGYSTESLVLATVPALARAGTLLQVDGTLNNGSQGDNAMTHPIGFAASHPNRFDVTPSMWFTNPAPEIGHRAHTPGGFTTMKQFMGSAYFLDRLGVDTTHPLFGHDFFEYSLVGPAIKGLSHKRWQDNDTETDDANGAMVSAQAIIINGTVVNAGTVHAQTQLAMNAPSVHNTGSISASDAMTINGELTNAGLMTANSMAIESDALVQNLGHMHAQQQLQINAGQFVNAGQAKSRQVHVVSSSDLVNQGAAHLSASDAMQLTSTNGSIINDVAVSNHQVDGFMAQTLDSTGMIHSGGKLHATAANNVTQLGKIIVDGDANIMAGNTIELGGTMIQHKGSDNRGDTEVSNYYGSSTSIGGNAVMASGGDTRVIGSQLDVGQTLGLHAKGDIRIEAMGQTHHVLNTDEGYEMTTQGHQASTVSIGGDAMASGANIAIQGSDLLVNRNATLVAESRIDVDAVSNSREFQTMARTNTDSQTTQQGANAMVGADLHLVSGTNARIHGSHASAGGNITIQSKNDVVVDGANNQHTHYHETNNGGGFLESRTTERVHDASTKHHASNVTAGGNLNIQSNGNVQVRGADISALGNATIQSNGDISVLAGRTTQASHVQTKMSAAYSHGHGHQMEKNSTVEASAIAVNGQFSLSSDGDIHVQSSTIHAGELTINADGGIAIVADQHNKQVSSEWTFNGLFDSTHRDDDMQSVRHESATLMSHGDITIDAGDQFQLAGSRIQSGGNARLLAHTNLTIESMVDSETKQTLRESSGFSGVSFSSKGASIRLNVDQKRDQKISRHQHSTQQASGVVVGGNLSTVSGGDTRIVGSDVVANGHANIAGDAIHVGSADNTRTVTDSHKTTIDTLSLTIGNAWVDGAVAANDAINAGQHAYNTGQGADAQTSSGAITKSVATVQMGASAMALGNAVANMAGSVATAGFYGAVSATHREQSSTQITTDTWARGSTIVSLNGNVAADARNDVRVTGSLVNANRGDITLSADEITINSATNNHNSTVVSAVKQSRKTLASSTGVVGLPTHSTRRTQSDASATTHTQSQVMADQGTITIHSRGNTRVNGAQVEGQGVVVNAGETLKVEAVQAINQSTETINGISIGATMGMDSGHSNANRAWVDDQTHIIGHESLTIQANSLDLNGAMVANATIDRDDHGIVTGITDGGNANINVTTLQTSDIADSHSNNAVHVGVTATNHTDIRVHQSGHHKEGVHRATIGNGTLSVAHGASRDPINRDLSAHAEVVIDKQDAGVDVGLTVDHRLITDTDSTVGKGVEGIIQLPNNMAQSVENGGKALVNLGAAIHDNATGNGHDGVLSDYRSRLRHQQLALHGKRHAALTQALNNVANNPQELEAQLMLVAKDAMVANDLGDGNVNVVVYHANDGAMGGYNNGNIYINLAYQDGSVQTLMTVLGDELSHYTDHAMGVTRTVSELDNGPTDVSRHHGDNAGEQTWGYVGHEPVDAQAFQDRLVGLDVESANTEVANANGMQHRITVQVQQVVGNNYHSLIKIAPENQALYKDDARFIPDDTGELYVTLGAGPSVELIPKLTSGTNRKKDKNQAIKVVESLPLTLPNGDEDATIRQLMALDANYNDELDYDLFPSQPADQKWYISDDSYNSNSYVSGLLTAANLDVPPLHPSIHLPGYTKPLPKGYFIHSKQEVNQ